MQPVEVRLGPGGVDTDVPERVVERLDDVDPPSSAAAVTCRATPSSSPRPFSTTRSAVRSREASFAETSNECGSAPGGMRTITSAASPTT
ncbi:Uncharacterised protein [Mycobacteroides abscessus subsp. abscessus]|nr:Uncharacterised protein [Mycobacteroides abscessus subsp. abscessus]